MPRISLPTFPLRAGALTAIALSLLVAAGCSGGGGAAASGGPVIQISSPISGAILAATVTVTATSQDPDGVTSIKAFIDSDLLGTDTDSDLTASWDTTSVLNGIHTVKVQARDALGNQSELQFNVVVQN